MDGKCRLFANEDPWKPVRVSQLSATDFAALEAALDLKAWPALAGSYFSGLPDGPTEEYWIDTGGTRAPLPQRGEQWNVAERIRKLATSYLALAAARGEELQGPVRYTLVQSATNGLLGELEGAAAWPLGEVGAYLTQPGETRRALDQQAAALRLLRARYQRGELGSTSALFIPILQPDGQRYELRMRDVAPYDDESQTDLAPVECTDAVYEAHARALADAASVGCDSDADCSLTDTLASCLGGCMVALPTAALPAYERAERALLWPLCAARADAGCQMPPPPDCAEVAESCREHACVAVESNR